MGPVDVRVCSAPLNINELIQFRPEFAHGAVNIFIGTVRKTNLGREVVRLDYDCFKPLCEKTFFEIAREAQSKWCEDACILIAHRHGELAVGEASVIIVASTGHRDESYRVSRYIIEEIKVRAPIWKKEYYQNGESEWVRGHALCQHRKDEHVHENHGSRSCGRTIHPHEN